MGHFTLCNNEKLHDHLKEDERLALRMLGKNWICLRMLKLLYIMMAAIEYALCSVGACMLGTRGANLNLVGDQSVQVETTNTPFVIYFVKKQHYKNLSAKIQ